MMNSSTIINKMRIYKAKPSVLKYTADFHYLRLYNHHCYLTPEYAQYPKNSVPINRPSFPPPLPNSLLLWTHLCEPNIFNPHLSIMLL